MAPPPTPPPLLLLLLPTPVLMPLPSLREI